MRKRTIKGIGDNQPDQTENTGSTQQQPTQTQSTTPVQPASQQPQSTQPVSGAATNNSTTENTTVNQSTGTAPDMSSTTASVPPPPITPSNPVQGNPLGGDSSTDEEKLIAEVAKAIGAEKDKDSKADFNPFGGNVKARGEHAEIKVDHSIKDEINEFVPPANILPPPVQESQNNTPPPPLNPEMQNLPPEQSREAAESMVDVIFEVYGMIKSFIGSKVKIDVASKKINELIKTAGLSLDMPLPLPDGGSTNFREIAANFDSQIEQTFVVTDSFKNKVREPMIQEFMKRGIGLTNMQRIGIFWTIELIQTGIQAFQMKSVANQLIQQQLEIQKALMQQMNTPPPPPPEQSKDDGKVEILEPEEL